MSMFQVGSIFVDVGVALVFVTMIIRIVQIIKFRRQNGGSTILTADQQRAIRRVNMPFAIIGLVFAVVGAILLFV